MNQYKSACSSSKKDTSSKEAASIGATLPFGEEKAKAATTS